MTKTCALYTPRRAARSMDRFDAFLDSARTTDEIERASTSKIARRWSETERQRGGVVARGVSQRTATLLTDVSDDESDARGRQTLAWKTTKLLPMKELFLEQQSRRDLLALGGESVLSADGVRVNPSKSIEFVLMMRGFEDCGDAKDVTTAMLREARGTCGYFVNVSADDITASVEHTATIENDNEQDADDEAGGSASSTRHVFAQAFYAKHSIVVAHEMSSFQRRRCVLMARLNSQMRALDDSVDSVDRHRPQFVAIVLGDPTEPPTKNVFATSHTIATMLSDSDFVDEALDCEDEKHFRELVMAYMKRGISPPVVFENDLSRVRFTPRRVGSCIVGDLRRRLPVYVSDWTDAWANVDTFIRVLSTTVWLASTTFIPALAIGLSMQSDSSRRMTHIDFLLSEAVCGIAFSIFGGQPLLILRVSGPIKTFLNVVRIFAESIECDFVAFYGFVGIYAGVMVLTFAMLNGAEYMLCINRFTQENLALFAAVTFIFNGFNAMATMREMISDDATFLKYFILHLGTVLTAFKILEFRRNAAVHMSLRMVIADLAPLITVLCVTGLSYAFPNVSVNRVSAALYNLPIWPTLVDLSSVSSSARALALVPASVLAVQIVLESNISAMLASRPHNKLAKGSAYNWDLFIMGIFTITMATFGLPPSIPALPHSAIHTVLLSKTTESARHGVIRTNVRRATETRVTNFIAHLITLIITLRYRSTFGRIPIASLSGFLVYMGLSSLGSNQMISRLPLLGNVVPSRFLRHVTKRTIHAYTAIQFLYFGAIFGCSMTVHRAPGFAVVYPLILASSVPFSHKILPRLLGDYQAHVLTTAVREENMVGLFY